MRTLELTGQPNPGLLPNISFTESSSNQGLLFFGYFRDRLSTAFGFLLHYETSKFAFKTL